ncbi:MAG: LysR family transcriptional regulator [Syntrophorhabdales bacterium]|jgi:DNA-binding transcriptional LysR family regulator
MKPDISYAKLKTFYYVVTENGFKRAAAKLFVTEGAVSQQIKDLEARLGKRLFERSTNRKVKLTSDGLNLFNLTAPFVEKFENIMDEFEQMSGVLTGSVRIASYGVMLLLVLPKYLNVFRNKYPECEIFLFNAVQEDIESMVMSGSVDFGIASVEDLRDGIVGNKIWEFKRYFVAPLGHPLANKKDLTFKDIAGAPVVMNRASRSGLRFLKELERHNPNLKVTVEAGDWDVVMNYVEMGFGVSVLPEVLVRRNTGKQIYFRDLKEVDPASGVSQYGLLLRRGKYLSPAARELIKVICPEFDFNSLGGGSTARPF